MNQRKEWYQKERNESWTLEELKQWQKEKGKVEYLTGLFDINNLMETSLYYDSVIKRSAVDKAKENIKKHGWCGDPLVVLRIIDEDGNIYGPAYVGRDAEIQALQEIFAELQNGYPYEVMTKKDIPGNIFVPCAEAYIRKNFKEIDETPSWKDIIKFIGEEDDCQAEYKLAMRSYELAQGDFEYTKDDKYTILPMFILDVGVDKNGINF